MIDGEGAGCNFGEGLGLGGAVERELRGNGWCGVACGRCDMSGKVSADAGKVRGAE